ncbi:MAG: hypothetical protein HQL60_07205 [Magnetococcales bacterium]|nr:hypothetical protein [Magnetococcales bacterium]
MNAPTVLTSHHPHEEDGKRKRRELALCAANGANIILILVILDLIYRASPPPQTTFTKFMIPPPRTIWDMDMIHQAFLFMSVMVVLTLARLLVGRFVHGGQWKRGDFFAMLQVLLSASTVVLLFVLF